MPTDPKQELEARLQALWLRRANLSEPEWTLLYRIVAGYLRARNFKAYGTLRRYAVPEDYDQFKRELVDDYFVDKVLRPARRRDFAPTPLEHIEVLQKYYRRYLLDQIDLHQREHERRNALEREINKLLSPDEAEQTLTEDDAQASMEAAEYPESGRSACLSDPEPSAGLAVGAAPDSFWNPEDVRGLAEAARAFLADNEAWVSLYLGCHFCPEPEHSVALSTLAKRQDIPSYHHKAQKLGITWPRGGFQDISAFKRTLLGVWLSANRVEVTSSEIGRVSAALKILCAEALKKVRAHGGCGH